MIECERLFTAADLAEMPTLLPSGGIRYELLDGKLHAKPPNGEIHGGIEARIAAVLMLHGEWEGHGKVASGEVGVVLGHGPDTVVGAAAVFLTRDQLPPRRSREGYLETIPALVVEVVSKNDRAKKVEGKVRLAPMRSDSRHRGDKRGGERRCTQTRSRIY